MYKTMDSPAPRKIVHCSGINSAERKVTIPAATDPREEAKTSRASGRRPAISSAPMTNSIPAMTLKGTSSANWPNSSTIRPNQNPANIPPQRDDAPAPTLIPVREREPPVPID